MKEIWLILTVLFFGIHLTSAQIQSEEITIYNKEIALPGTLTYLKKNTPLIIWLHGSGPVNRAGNQPVQKVHANYIHQFRAAVNTENIAFFSYDKRTANQKNRAFFKDTSIMDFAMDAKSVIHYFKKTKQFSEIILIGHSHGSLIAMLALKNVDKYISIAGAGARIDKIMVQQISKNNATLGAAAKQQFDTLRIKGAIKVINPFLINVFAKPMQSFWYSWMQLNPLEEIKKINIPILIIQGAKDLQVTIEDSTALHRANPNAKLILIENMNHVLKDIQDEKDNLLSYYSSTYAISKKLVQHIVTFIKK
jgi:hypothetical protein